jgi:hypothetical protein
MKHVAKGKEIRKTEYVKRIKKTKLCRKGRKNTKY